VSLLSKFIIYAIVNFESHIVDFVLNLHCVVLIVTLENLEISEGIKWTWYAQLYRWLHLLS